MNKSKTTSKNKNHNQTNSKGSHHRHFNAIKTLKQLYFRILTTLPQKQIVLKQISKLKKWSYPNQ